MDDDLYYKMRCELMFLRNCVGEPDKLMEMRETLVKERKVHANLVAQYKKLREEYNVLKKTKNL